MMTNQFFQQVRGRKVPFFADPSKPNRAIRVRARLVLTALVVSCSALLPLGDQPAAAPMLEFSDAQFTASARITNASTGALSEDEDVATAPLPARGVRVNAFLEDKTSGDQFLIPVNPSLEAFAASDVTDGGAFNVGVSGLLNLGGFLTAQVEHSYEIRNADTVPLTPKLSYRIPEIELSLAGVENQAGQSAYVAMGLDYNIFNADGSVHTSGNVYDIRVDAIKDLPGAGSPLGFRYDWSDDLQALLADTGLEFQVNTFENVLGDFDVESITLAIIDGRAQFPDLQPEQTIRFDRFAVARLSVPGVNAEYGGQARIGDPFSLNFDDGFLLEFVEGGDPLTPISEPSTLWLACSGLVSILALRRRRSRHGIADRRDNRPLSLIGKVRKSRGFTHSPGHPHSPCASGS